MVVDVTTVDAKIRKVMNVEVLYIQKTYISSGIYDSINIFIHFVWFVNCVYFS